MMIREFCAGGLVFFESQLLILKRLNGVWLFPKGHIESGETPEMAALREVREESGITAEIIRKIDSTTYTFLEKGVKHLKTVDWFLMVTDSNRIDLEKDFFNDGMWISKEQRNILSFPADQALADSAFTFISTLKGD
jgi:8-oxo-dGTP pyrophosphatase MutT (NUDIX family)